MRLQQAVDPDAARREAQHILSDGRFHPSPAPRPFRGPVQWVGDRVSGIVNWLESLPIPGWLWIAIGLGILAAVIARIITVARRRSVTHPPAGARAYAPTEDESEDPDVLERAADTAERDGDLARAIRLRFRAGLLRLGERGAIDYRPSLTTSEVRRALGSRTFDELARTFESVAYGGTLAAGPDVEAARRDWPRVVAESSKS